MNETVFLIIVLLIFTPFLYICYTLLVAMLSGAPYAPVGAKRLDIMLSLLQLKPGDNVVDLGSGDGRIVIACAKKGAKAVGYEVVWPLVVISRKKIRDGKIKHATIRNKSFWNEDFSSFNCVTAYLTGHTLGRLEKKLFSQMRPGSRIVTNHYQFPNKKHSKQVEDAYLYIV